MLTPHIVKSFDGHLKGLHDLICKMGDLAAGMVDGSLQALEKGDQAIATQTNTLLEEAGHLNHAVNEQVIRVLALRSPVADDLRVVTTALKIAGDLEQICSYAASNARRTLTLQAENSLPVATGIHSMGLLALRQLRTVMDAYQIGDADSAAVVWYEDWRLDEQYSGLFRQTLTYMLEDPATITAASHLLFIAKNLERIGDHATNIAEMIHFLVTGTPLAGERRKGDSSISLSRPA